jgi:hypothetical protein
LEAGRRKLGEIRKGVEGGSCPLCLRMQDVKHFFTCLKNNGENKIVEQQLVGHE